VAALLPAIAQADVLEFTTNGSLAPSRDSNGPYVTFQTTFLANPLASTSQGSQGSYTFAPGGCLASVNADLSIYDFKLTVDGKQVMTGGRGSFNVGTPSRSDAGCRIWFGDAGVEVSATAKGKIFNTGGNYDFEASATESEIRGSKDPLGLILNDASFPGDPQFTSIVACTVPGYPPSLAPPPIQRVITTVDRSL